MTPEVDIKQNIARELETIREGKRVIPVAEDLHQFIRNYCEIPQERSFVMRESVGM